MLKTITLRCSKMSTHATSTSIARFQKCVNPLFSMPKSCKMTLFSCQKGAKVAHKRKNAALNGGTASLDQPTMPPQRHCEQQQAPHDRFSAATTRAGRLQPPDGTQGEGCRAGTQRRGHEQRGASAAATLQPSGCPAQRRPHEQRPGTSSAARTQPITPGAANSRRPARTPRSDHGIHAGSRRSDRYGHNL